MTSDSVSICCGVVGLLAVGAFFALWFLCMFFQCETCYRISFVEDDGSYAGMNVCISGWGCKKWKRK